MNEFTDKQIENLTRQYNQSAKYILQPLSSIHLNSNLMWEAEVNGDARTVYFLMVIAFIILIIAWVNYINLSTVKAIFRSREVAMRKISGASRMHLIRQFLVESFVINLIATLLAFILVVVSIALHPVINRKGNNDQYSANVDCICSDDIPGSDRIRYLSGAGYFILQADRYFQGQTYRGIGWGIYS